MTQNFWSKLEKPVFVLAPMANVTDAAFRRMFATYGKPDVFVTEFVSVDGLLSLGRERLLVDFWFTEAERPIVAQIFGSNPAHFEEVAGMIRDLGFDGIDINMGCPDRGVENQGAGAALIKNPQLARELIRAAKRGSSGLPVSVKTRIGYTTNQLDEWLTELLEEDLAALTVHLRTRKEMSDVPAHWEVASAIADLRNTYAPQTILIGNGDIADLADARHKVKETGIDGVMVGRGAFGKPWFFTEKEPSIVERLRQLVEHTELFEKLFITQPLQAGQKRYKSFDIMKKHFKAYTLGVDGSKELRIQLMETENVAQVRAHVDQFIDTYLASSSH